MDATSVLSGWENFYVIVGSSGAALIGLQFVVTALIADREKRISAESVNAFGTPVVVHLAGTVLIAAIMSAPWSSLLSAALALAFTGIAGLAYLVVTVRRTRHQTEYRPVGEDWAWHVVLPAIAYGVLTAASMAALWPARGAFFLVGGAALGLLFVSIRNAWDSVVYIVTGGFDEQTKTEPPKA